MAYDSRSHRVLLYSGVASSDGRREYRSNLWAWDGTAWTELATDGPPGRTDGYLAFDPARGVLVLHGGRRFGATRGDLTILADTWEWNGSAWRLVDSLTPGTRMHGGMAYDAARRTTVLFGGFAEKEDSIRNDTWEWNGRSWIRQADGPARRWVNGLVSSPGGTLLHAALRDGYDRSAGTAPGELWRWTAGTWARTDSAPRLDPQSPVVPQENGLLFYAGWMLNQPALTWVWDAGGWRRIPGEQPPRRRGTAMAYDAGRRVAVLFGGETDRELLGDLWEFDGQVWRKRQ
jgi:hypothetical protein